MKLRLNNLALCPPEPVGGFVNAAGQPVTRRGHWWAYVEATDVWVFGGNYHELVEAFRQHLITNGQPVPGNIDEAVQTLICQMAPPTWKRGCVATDGQGFSLGVTLALAKRWVRTMAAFVANGSLVPQDEAERRAQTCLRCHYRVPITGCKGCGKSLAGLITQTLIDRKTAVDDQLSACGVCGCAQRALVHFDNATLDKGSAGLEYPTDTDGRGTPCWRRSETKP